MQTQGSEEIFILIHVYFQSYLCLPLDAVLFSFFMYYVFKVAYRPDGPGV